MASAIKCPSCESNHTRRCEMAYEQSISQTDGPRYSTTHVSNIAARVAPPSPPLSPAYWRLRYARFGIPAGLLILAAFAIAIGLIAEGKGSVAPFVIAPISVGTFLLWHGFPPAGSLDAERYNQQLEEYNSAFDLYQRLWICFDCGHVFKP